MATKVNETTTAIVLPDSAQIQKMPKFQEIIPQLNKMTADLIALEGTARTMKVATPEDFQIAGAAIASIKAIVKDAKELVDPYSSALRKWTDFVRTHLNIVANRGEQAKGILERMMSDYVNAENRKSEDEKKRLEAQAKAQIAREVSEKKMLDLESALKVREAELKDAKAQFNTGKIKVRAYEKLVGEIQGRFNQAKAQIQMEAQARIEQPVEINVAPLIPSTPGVVKRVNYHAECSDPDAFLLEFAKRFVNGDRSLRKFVVVSDQALSAEAREVESNEKMEATYPHVHAWFDRTF